MSQKLILKAKGVSNSSNPLSKTPDGSTYVASNVIFDKDGLFRPRRGIYNDTVTIAGSGDARYPHAMAKFDGTTFLSCQKQSGAASPTDWDMYVYISGASYTRLVYTNFTGTSPSIQPPDKATAKTKFVQAMKSLFFTSSAGILKMDSKVGTEGVITASSTSPQASPAGMLRADDPQAFIMPQKSGAGTYETGFMEPDTSYAYSVCWCMTDRNGIVVIGPPSGRRVVRNPTYAGSVQLTASGGIFVTDGANSFKPSFEEGFSTLAAGDEIEITPEHASQNPSPTEKTVASWGGDTGNGDTTVKFSQTGAVGPTSGFTLSFGTRPVKVRFNRPPNYLSGVHFAKVFRTKRSASASSEPPSDMYLCYEGLGDTGDVSRSVGTGAFQFEDYTTDDLLGEPLYTNPSEEGELQANHPPPLANDMCLFKNHMFYANTKQPHRLELDLLSVLGNEGIQNGDVLRVGHRTYTATTGTPVAGEFKLYSVGTLSQQQAVRETVRDLIRCINSDSVGVIYRAYDLSGPTDRAGKFIIETRGPGTLSSSFLQTEGFAVAFSASRKAFSPELPTYSNLSVTNYVRTSDVATITVAAHGLGIGDWIQIHSSAGTILNGLKRITAVTANTISYSEVGSNVVSTAVTASLFKATLYSTDDAAPNRLHISKEGLVEYCPLLQYLDVGSPLYGISRVGVAGDSLFVLKDDGVYRVTGDGVDSFRVDPFDPTVRILAPNSLAPLANSLYFLSNQGVVALNESGVSIVSKPIDAELKELYVSNATNVRNASTAAGYESERIYMLSTPSNTSTGNETLFIYDIVGKNWAKWGVWASMLFVDPTTDILWLGDKDRNYLRRERKTGTTFDYADQEVSTTATATSSSTVVTVASTSGVVAKDILVVNDLTHLRGIVTEVISATQVRIDRNMAVTNGDPVDFHKPFSCTIGWNSSVAGADGPSGLKHFRSIQLLFADAYFYKAQIRFRNDLHDSTGDYVSVYGDARKEWDDIGNWSSDLSERTIGNRVVECPVPRSKARGSQLIVEVRFQYPLELWALSGITITFNGPMTEGKVKR
jgi:hypothetical protein